ncbi:MAG: hypothetical protein SFU85_13135 [Candidatus Methylacidiphilales bacterium]|nr:hypothetical protein [Candidatus Methylacidiphilales bacterium]
MGIPLLLAVVSLGAQEPASAPSTPPRAEPVADDLPLPIPQSAETQPLPAVNPEAGRDGQPTDPSRPIEVRILSPRSREIIPTSTVDVFLQVDNYLLAEEGNRLHVLVDNQPPQPWHDVARPFPLKNLNQGGHTVRVLAVRPDGTSLRQPGAFAMVHFFVKKKDFQNYTDPTLPFLTVNLPAGGPASLDANERLCFDYWVHNVDFSGEHAVRLRYKLDVYEGTLTEPGPVLWANLQPGRHRLLVELFDAAGQPIFGPFNRVEREFEIRQILRAVPLPPETHLPQVPGAPLP